VVQPVEHDLRDRTLAERVVARLVQNAGRHAVGRARQILRTAGKAERSCGRVWIGREGHGRIERTRVVGAEIDELDGFDLGHFGLWHDPAWREFYPLWRLDDDGRVGDDERGPDDRQTRNADEAGAQHPGAARGESGRHCSGRKSGTDR